jgi:hypothetical protein
MPRIFLIKLLILGKGYLFPTSGLLGRKVHDDNVKNLIEFIYNI